MQLKLGSGTQIIKIPRQELWQDIYKTRPQHLILFLQSKKLQIYFQLKSTSSVYTSRNNKTTQYLHLHP